MRRAALFAAASVAVLAAVAPALAAPRLTAVERAKIGALVDRFVKDVVLRRNLADGWSIAGPDLRGGTTREAWVKGTGVTVESFPVIGNDFSHAWSGGLVSPTRAELTMTLHTRGRNSEIVSEQVVLLKLDGRWVVDILYPGGIIRLGHGHSGSCGTPDCAVSGANDYGPQGGTGGSLGLPASEAARWLWIVLGSIAGVIVATAVGLLFHVRRRDRRARQAYETARGLR